MTKHDEPTIRVTLTRPVEGGFGPGPADMPASMAHRLVAGGLATVIPEEESTNETADATDDTATSSEGAQAPDEPTAKRATHRKR